MCGLQRGTLILSQFHVGMMQQEIEMQMQPNHHLILVTTITASMETALFHVQATVKPLQTDQ